MHHSSPIEGEEMSVVAIRPWTSHEDIILQRLAAAGKICRCDRGRDEPQRGRDPKSRQPSESHAGQRPTRSESEGEGKMTPRRSSVRPWTPTDDDRLRALAIESDRYGAGSLSNRDPLACCPAEDYPYKIHTTHTQRGCGRRESATRSAP